MPTAMNHYKYLHLLSGQPAKYYLGQQICFMKDGESLVFCDSLRQLRREQRDSARWREERGYSDYSADYGYLRVRV